MSTKDLSRTRPSKQIETIHKCDLLEYLPEYLMRFSYHALCKPSEKSLVSNEGGSISVMYGYIYIYTAEAIHLVILSPSPSH